MLCRWRRGLRRQLGRIEGLLAELVRLETVETPEPAPAQRGFSFAVGPTVKKKETPAMPLDLSFSTEEKVKVAVHPASLSGKPVLVDGPVSFTVVTGDCTIEPIDDASAFIVSGANGVSLVSVSADADLGAGVKTITDTITCSVTDPQASSLGLTADAPVLK